MEHNCSNYWGKQNCSQCLTDAKSEVQQLKLQNRELQNAVDRANAAMLKHQKHNGALEIAIQEAHRDTDAANRLNGELKNALHRDKTGLAAALNMVLVEVGARRWVVQGRGSYNFDDDGYRKETGFALDAIEAIAREALQESGKLADSALIEKRNDATKCFWCGAPIQGEPYKDKSDRTACMSYKELIEAMDRPVRG